MKYILLSLLFVANSFAGSDNLTSKVIKAKGNTVAPDTGHMVSEYQSEPAKIGDKFFFVHSRSEAKDFTSCQECHYRKKIYK